MHTFARPGIPQAARSTPLVPDPPQKQTVLHLSVESSTARKTV